MPPLFLRPRPAAEHEPASLRAPPRPSTFLLGFLAVPPPATRTTRAILPLAFFPCRAAASGAAPDLRLSETNTEHNDFIIPQGKIIDSSLSLGLLISTLVLSLINGIIKFLL